MKILFYMLGVYFALSIAANGQSKPFAVVAPATVKTGDTVEATVRFRTQWPRTHSIIWTVNGAASGPRFTPAAPGKYIVTAREGNATSSAEVRVLPKQVLIFGNSISIAPPDHQIWWMAYGMAASDPDHDYVHLLAGMYGANVVPHYCRDWESAHSGFDYSQYDSFFSPMPDLVWIRLGENVPYDLVRYQEDLTTLIGYIRSKAPNAVIDISGQFWPNAEKDAIHQQVAESLHISYTSFVGIDSAENETFIGAMVQGDDGAAHPINHGAVAQHPGDRGMAAIATALYEGTFQ